MQPLWVTAFIWASTNTGVGLSVLLCDLAALITPLSKRKNSHPSCSLKKLFKTIKFAPKLLFTSKSVLPLIFIRKIWHFPLREWSLASSSNHLVESVKLLVCVKIFGVAICYPLQVMRSVLMKAENCCFQSKMAKQVTNTISVLVQNAVPLSGVSKVSMVCFSSVISFSYLVN